MWRPRKCDYWTDGRTDAGQSDPIVPLCFAGNKKSIWPKIINYSNATYFWLDHFQRLRQYNDDIPEATFEPKCCWFPGTTKPVKIKCDPKLFTSLVFLAKLTPFTAASVYFYLNLHNNVNFRCWDDIVIFAPFQLKRHAISSIWRHNIITYLNSKTYIFNRGGPSNKKNSGSILRNACFACEI